ncbi:hypothetical protein I79_018985 [Cricetulus griseus]|uniref:Uncharacterized protein n=1 Tax=Cricetulus griseus TaxID=10029 RepID=G3I673_CRIGR|nr:hypothetical protein I79_018985 [Cricetulus griseus]
MYLSLMVPADPSTPKVEAGDHNITVAWWHMPLIPALGRQRQADLCEFEANLVYRASSSTARATHRETLFWG